MNKNTDKFKFIYLHSLSRHITVIETTCIRTKPQ